MARWTSGRSARFAWMAFSAVWMAASGLFLPFVSTASLSAAEPADQPRIGRFVRLAPPLVKGKDRVQRIVNDTITAAARTGARPVFVFELEP
ncbi:MAG: hypothetical protein JNM18_26405, partial [Planctomycetaceae bacterium]|nr:hypothetical protein [Planctomycetaceae bacterium]